jgi:hypothetical protein
MTLFWLLRVHKCWGLVEDWPRIGLDLAQGFYKVPIYSLYPLYILCLYFPTVISCAGRRS